MKWNGYFDGNNFNFKSSKTENQLHVFVYDGMGKAIQTDTYKNQVEFQLKLNNLKNSSIIKKKKKKNFPHTK